MRKFLLLTTILLILVLGAFYFSRLTRDTVTEIENITTEINEAEEKKPHPDSIPALAEKEFEGNNLQLVKVIEENDFYTRHSITYESEGLTISGIMNIPKGEGPFPVLILNHGYVSPSSYTSGGLLEREQDFFAKSGYAVLYSDYRGYGFSDPDPYNDVRPRTGYVEDVLNAISALKKSNLEKLEITRIGILGHSMGGGVTENIMVTKPDVAKAYVLLAPIHANYKVNFDRWVKNDSDFEGITEQFYERYGTYEENPETWESFSAINYVDRINSPVMLHQGTADTLVPTSWSKDFVQALENSNKTITYYEYPGEGHIFRNAQETVMQRTLDFFNKNLKND